MDTESGRNRDTNPGDLVAKVNIVVEEESLEAGDWIEAPAGSPDGTEPDVPPEKTPILQAVLLGVVAVIVIAISMFLILQGVFEMIPS